MKAMNQLRIRNVEKNQFINFILEYFKDNKTQNYLLLCKDANV